jgi:hypothetical protein
MPRLLLLLFVATLSGCLFPITKVSRAPFPIALDTLPRDTTIYVELAVTALDGSVVHYAPPVLIGPRGVAGRARNNGERRWDAETPRDSIASISVVRRETSRVREFVVMSAVTLALQAAVLLALGSLWN